MRHACHAGVSCVSRALIGCAPVQQQAHVHVLPVELGVVVPKDLGACHNSTDDTVTPMSVSTAATPIAMLKDVARVGRT